MASSWIPAAFLGISLGSLVVYTAALTKLPPTRTPPGLRRTALSRVLAAVLYVLLGSYALITEAGVEALLVFGFVQLLWQANAVADVRLRRRLAVDSARHRRRP